MNAQPRRTIFQTPLGELLGALDERSQDIVRRRFGLETGNRETLESIGKEYSITRERVRQIEAHAKKILRTRLSLLDPVHAVLQSIFKDKGGILLPEAIVNLVKETTDDSVRDTLVYFYLELLLPYEYSAHDPLFSTHWRYPDYVSLQAGITAKAGQKILVQAKQPLSEANFIAEVCQLVPTASAEHVGTWLSASRHITKNPFGEWGLVGWPEMTPRGVGDKAYAVLRRHGKPEHFRMIATMINEAQFDRKVANPQTVHNELIKDNRFVLVGRGLYGLTQWGYVPGTVADVVESVLHDAKRPLDRDEIIEKVLEQRMVKKNTILLSLQDRNRFVKTLENRYTLNKKS